MLVIELLPFPPFNRMYGRALPKKRFAKSLKNTLDTVLCYWSTHQPIHLTGLVFGTARFVSTHNYQTTYSTTEKWDGEE
jgi:hypothetical protein